MICMSLIVCMLLCIMIMGAHEFFFKWLCVSISKDVVRDTPERVQQNAAPELNLLALISGTQLMLTAL